MFVGRYRLEGVAGAPTVEVSAAGADAFHFTVSGRTEAAWLAGRMLVVEEPPNYRLYRLEADGRVMVLVGDEAFRYGRVR